MAPLRSNVLAAACLAGLAACPARAARLMHGGQPAVSAQEIARKLELRRSPAAAPGAVSPEVAATSRDPRNVGRAFAGALEATSAALRPMLADPPDGPAGLHIFGEKLWEAMLLLLPEDLRASGPVLQAKADWSRAFETAPPSISEDVRIFDTTGNTDKLVRAMLGLVKVAMAGSGWALPQSTKCLAAVADLLEGLGEAWGMHSSGKIAEALQVVWLGARTAVEEAVEVNVTKGTYEAVLEAVDGPMADFTKQILDIKRAHLLSKVCYKQREARNITRPSKCRDGFSWDGQTSCIPDSKHGANCWEPCGGKAGACPDFCGRGKVCCKHGSWFDPRVCSGATGYVRFDFAKSNSREYHQCVTPKQPASLAETQRLDRTLVGKTKPVNGRYDAECDMASAELQGDWCFNECREGFVALGRQCEQSCGGPFPANAFGMCGTSTMDLTVATLEMDAIASNAAWSPGDLLAELSLGDTGVDPKKLSRTAYALLTMGKPFPRPACPDLVRDAQTMARNSPKAEAPVPEPGPRPERPKV